MQLLDWTIVGGLLITLLLAALRTRRYTKTVSGFLAAERCGGRYIISMAHAAAGLGVISLVYWFEMYYENGFTGYWWGSMTEPALIVIALSGFVFYRFRQTRAMTLAQFFEMRYSRNFRVFSGLVAYLAGIINFGIFPAVGARFFIALCGLEHSYTWFGVAVSTHVLLMLGLLSISLLFTFLGGHIAVMVTDFVQGAFVNVVFAGVVFYLLFQIRWERMAEIMLAAEPGRSLVDPFDIGEQSHFNIWYYVIAVVIVFYSTMGWQGTQGYYCCAKNAHEAKMANILNYWRFRVLLIVAIITPIAVRTVLYHPHYAQEAAAIAQSTEALQHHVTDAAELATLQKQLRTPHALAVILPSGLLGLMCAAMLAAFISTHDTYLHSWGTIFVQDVILPFRKEPFTPRQHLWLLRASIFGVAGFIFCFSLLFRQTQFIAMFCAITASVFIGGAGAVIIGGLYWKRGTTAAAWTAMTTGLLLSLGGIVTNKLWPEVPLTGQEMTFVAIVCSVGSYVIVSLVGPGHQHNMDRLLHRGRYALPEDRARIARRRGSWLERLGVDPEFTGWDRFVTLISVGWPVAWMGVFTAGAAWYAWRRTQNQILEDEAWLGFWHIFTWVLFASAVAVTVWFTIGGVRDLRYLFGHLNTGKIDVDDDGRVISDPDPAEE
ncbi:MAG: sodium:solute symporter [Planctomycetota bacterium]|nr:sodium:solute symporter [Planctomycetota bacterium]